MPLLFIDPLLTVLTIGLVIPFILAVRYFDRQMRDVAKRSRAAVGEVANVVDESVRGMRVLKGLKAENRVSAELGRAADHLEDVNLKGVAIRSRYLPVLSLLPAAAVTARRSPT